ncbi:hypothetical protein ACFXAW_30565 [Streptomyces sp. NPDC059445]|uniref:zinc ribbon domain-containing protein n=1 Tax=Streptomyces sp. NPDC059445 TaxID=3346832 RepID=UPI003691B6C9
MPAFCPHCGGAVTDEARYCASCGRPTAAPSPALPPPPASPPAVPGTAQTPSAAATALTRLVTGDWIAPARIAALPTALLLLVSLVLAATAAAEDAPFGGAFLTALAVVLSALGAHPGLELTERDSASLASLDLSFMPLGLTLLWAAALWFGARLHLRGAAAAGRRLGTAETVFLGVRSVLSAVLGSVLLAWTAGTSVALGSSDASDSSAAYVARLLGLSDVTLSVTCSPLRAAWWTLLLASLVLFPTLGRTAMSAWAAHRPALGDWLRAARRAGVALAVPLALAGLGAVVFVVSQAGMSALIPALLLAPNLGAAVLSLACGASVEFTDTLTFDSSSWSEGGDGSDSSTAVSLFELHDLSGWLWASVLLGVVAAVLLGAGVLRESARPAAAVRAVVCFVAGFLLTAVMAGVGLELSSDIDDSSYLAMMLSRSLDISPTDGSALTVGPSVPGVLFAATVWAALGAFAVPAVARRLGVTRVEDLPGAAALVGRLRPTGRSGHAAAALHTVPVPASAVSSPVLVAAAPAGPVASPVSPQVPDVSPVGVAPRAAAEPTPATDGGVAGIPADAESEPVEAADDRPSEATADAAAPSRPEPTADPTEAPEPAAEAAGTEQESVEPLEPSAEPAETPAEPTDEPAAEAEGQLAIEPEAVPTVEPTESAATPGEPTDEPAVDSAAESEAEPAGEPEDQPAAKAAVPTPTAVGVPVDAPPAAPPAPPALTPASLSKAPGARPQAVPAGAGPHAAVFAGLPTGSMAYPGSPHQVVHTQEQPRPVRRRIGWGVITATLVASAVLAGGASAAAIWLTSDRSAPSSHTARATDDAAPPAAGAPSPSSAPASVAPTGPSDAGGSPSASDQAEEDIATQVQSLLEENAPQRGRVAKALTAGGSCSHGKKPVEDAHDELLDVALKRDDLARRVDLLTPRADGDLAEALGDLSRAWTASAKADRGYASWVSQTADWLDEFGVTACGHSETRITDDLPRTHDDEATEAKRDFVDLWNPIALRYGLPQVEARDI